MAQEYPSLWQWIFTPGAAAVGTAVAGGLDATEAKAAVARGEVPPPPPPGVLEIDWYTAVLGSTAAAQGYLQMLKTGAAGGAAAAQGLPNAAWGGVGLGKKDEDGPWLEFVKDAGRVVMIGGVLVGGGYVVVEVVKAVAGAKGKKA